MRSALPRCKAILQGKLICRQDDSIIKSIHIGHEELELYLDRLKKMKATRGHAMGVSHVVAM